MVAPANEPKLNCKKEVLLRAKHQLKHHITAPVNTIALNTFPDGTDWPPPPPTSAIGCKVGRVEFLERAVDRIER